MEVVNEVLESNSANVNAKDVIAATHGLVLCEWEGGHAVKSLVNDSTKEVTESSLKKDRMRRWYTMSPVGVVNGDGDGDGGGDDNESNNKVKSESDSDGAYHAKVLTSSKSDKIDSSTSRSGSSSSSSYPPKCALLGLPPNVSKDALLEFLDPYQTDITSLDIFPVYPYHLQNEQEMKTRNKLRSSSCAVVEFTTQNVQSSFVDIYNNLHFTTSHTSSDVASNENENDKESFTDDNNDDNDNTVPILVLPILFVETELARPDLLETRENNVPLPSCALCLRRLGVGYSHIRGGNEIPVSLKFTGNQGRCGVCRLYGTYVNQTINAPEQQATDVVSSSSTNRLVSIEGDSRGGIQLPNMQTQTISSAGAFVLPAPRPIATFNVDSVTVDSVTVQVQQQARNRAQQELLRLKARENSLWKCCDRRCGLAENIWVCMLCGYTGCGRYANQHAKQHYHKCGHTASLELVTGRIWDYLGDTFVHSEGLPYEEFLYDDNLGEGDASYNEDTTQKANGVNMSSRSTVMLGEPEGCNLSRSSTLDLHQDRSESSGALTGNAASKMSAVHGEYEGLLDSQLVEQKLFFEKVLAQETVHALEKVYRSSKHEHEHEHEGRTDLYLFHDEEATEMNMNMMDFESAFGHYTISEDTEEDFKSIEKRKIETSLIEQEHLSMLVEIREVESATRAMKAGNSSLIKHVKALKHTHEDVRLRTEQIDQKFKGQSEELQQSIRDLEFFLKTRMAVGNSSERAQNEIQAGSLEIRTKKQEPTKKASSRGRK